jgi:hypothetical protein
MMNKCLIFLVSGLMLISCGKDDITVHSGHTRINYSVEAPLEMPGIYFELDESYDLMGFTNCSVTLIADGNAPNLSLTIILEDEEGNKTDQSPFVLTKSQINKDGQSHTYSYDFETNLQSSTGSTGRIDVRAVKRVYIYINSGILGEAEEGYFWLDKIQFTSSDK